MGLHAALHTAFPGELWRSKRLRMAKSLRESSFGSHAQHFRQAARWATWFYQDREAARRLSHLAALLEDS